MPEYIMLETTELTLENGKLKTLQQGETYILHDSVGNSLVKGKRAKSKKLVVKTPRKGKVND